MKKRFWLICAVILAPLIVTAHSGSPSMVTWTTGQKLTATDLNNAFAHVHNTFSGGIVDTNISATAAIQHSKMATPALLPRAWAAVIPTCAGATVANCPFTAGAKVASVSGFGTAGKYNVTLSYVPVDGNFGVFITPGSNVVCSVSALQALTPNFVVTCTNPATSALTDAAFSVLVMDDQP